MKGVCRICGCIETNACMTEDGPCAWVLPNLCDACVVSIEGNPNVLVPKDCADCTNLGNFELDTFRCAKGRFDYRPKEFSSTVLIHRSFAWSGIVKPNKTVQAAQKKCPYFEVKI